MPFHFSFQRYEGVADAGLETIVGNSQVEFHRLYDVAPMQIDSDISLFHISLLVV
jgi:hypothetical protein